MSPTGGSSRLEITVGVFVYAMRPHAPFLAIAARFRFARHRTLDPLEQLGAQLDDMIGSPPPKPLPGLANPDCHPP